MFNNTRNPQPEAYNSKSNNDIFTDQATLRRILK